MTRWFFGLLLLFLLLAGCTAQQWDTTKKLALLPVLLGVAVLVETPPVVTTRCQTVSHGNSVKTVCTTY